MKRIVIAAIAGGLIVFFVSAILHMATPLGTSGMKAIPNEDAVVDQLRSSLTDNAVYIYPGLDMQASPTEEQQKAWEAKVRRGPSGLIIHTAHGAEPAFPQQLMLEFLAVVCSCLVAAWLLSRMVGTYAMRALSVTSLALFAFFSLSASHWIWYRFPSPFLLAELVGEVIAYLLAGLAIAKIVPPPVPQ
jgi:hypothetical protein